MDERFVTLVENVHVEALVHSAHNPAIEIHSDRDITWRVTPGRAWSNCGVALRFKQRDASARLDQILARYRQNGRGAGFWVSPLAQPANLDALLKARRLRCRKYFPAMVCDLNRRPLSAAAPPVRIELLDRYSQFDKAYIHPAIGPITTPLRRFELSGRQSAALVRQRQSFEFLALHDGEPAGACTVFVGKAGAGIFDLAVQPQFRRRGIGYALVDRACRHALDCSAREVILISTNEGYSVYRRAGFIEAFRIGFWYTAG